MLRTHIIHCTLPKESADTLNRESGRIYTDVLVEHYRVYQHTGHWLSGGAGEKINDHGSGTILHAHSRDAAQQGFYKACKTASAYRKVGLEVRYPHRRKTYRTTIWKNTGIRKQGEVLLLSMARGKEPVQVSLPSQLIELSGNCFLEMRLVWEQAARRYEWHAVIEDRLEPLPPPGEKVAAVDLGEIHPAAATDGEEGIVFTARALHCLSQNTNRRLAEIQARLSKKERHSRRYQCLMACKTRFLAQQKRRRRDMEHKVSRSVVEWAVEQEVGTLAIGDVRDVADGVNLGKQTNQRVSNWPHGKIRKYIEYKAEAAGIRIELVDEAYTSQTCPSCQHRYKPRGRVYTCPACGFFGHRDIVGATNILSRYEYGAVGRIPASISPTKYRHPFWVMRSRLDTAQVARVEREAAGVGYKVSSGGDFLQSSG
jgi:putative transposase